MHHKLQPAQEHLNEAAGALEKAREQLAIALGSLDKIVEAQLGAVTTTAARAHAITGMATLGVDDARTAVHAVDHSLSELNADLTPTYADVN